MIVEVVRGIVGSSWDSGSSWDWDDDDYTYSRSSGGGFYFFGGSFGGFLTFIIIMAVISILINKSRKNREEDLKSRRRPVDYSQIKNPFNSDEIAIENEVQENDPLFNKAEFLSFASDLFIKLQYAWSDRNLESVRVFQTPELYEQTMSQINR